MLVAAQMLVVLLQLMPLQQVCAAAPQGVHWPLEHRKPPEQTLPAQQGCPVPPHVPQVPFEQTSVGRVHLLPAQQGCPESPQVAHLPVAVLQISVALLHWVAPAQQGCVGPPQAVQEPAAQTVPAAVHELPAQQGWFAPPQAKQFELEQIEPFAQTVPQQGWVALPHDTQVLVALHVVPELQVVPQQG